MKSSLHVAVIGSSGYTGEELLKICLRHPGIQLVKITSRQFAGTRLKDFLGIKGSDLAFEDLQPAELANQADVFFLGLPHGVSAEYAVPLLEQGKTVFDLSADFRLKNTADYREFYGKEHPAPQFLEKSVYGLPELYAKELKKAQLIACPGCYPTSTILALAPVLREKLIDAQQIVVNSLSGVSGTGKKVEREFTYCQCNENLRAYGIPKHRHLPEMEQELSKLAGEKLKISFTPHLVSITRGMLTTISAPFAGKNVGAVQKAYEFYQKSPFIRVLEGDQLPETRRVMNSNYVEIAWRLDERTNRLSLVCAIDNLGKGAARQAVQAFNLRFGFPEEEGI